MSDRTYLSEDQFAVDIASNLKVGLGAGDCSRAASVIWKRVAAYIEETENRIIDAEFAKTDAENKLAALSAKPQ